MTLWQKIKHSIWDDFSGSPAEKKLVRKLDFYILTFCCVSFFFNYLDRAAFANAYVAGLKTDLKLTAKQYSNLLSILTAGYVVGQYPHSIIIHKVAPRIWFPSMVVIWAGLTMCSAAAHSYAALAVIRFFQGVIEASTYCGTLYVMGSWMKPQEIAKRTAIFSISGQLGTMFAGVMMTAVRKGLDGRAGLPGWRWVFLIDGLITLPIAIFGFLTFPDTPESTKAFWISPDERQLASDRLPPKRPWAHDISFISVAKRCLTSPYFWTFNLFSAVCGALEAFCTQGCFLLWLSANKYPSAHNTTYPLGISAVAIVCQFVTAVYMDITGNRARVGVLAAGLQSISAIMLLVRDLPAGGTFFAYYLAGSSYIVNPLLFGWANVILKRTGDDVLRSLTLYSMNAASSILYTFWGIALYPGSDAPYYKKGCIAMLCIAATLCAMLILIKRLDKQSKEYEEAYLASVAQSPEENAAAMEMVDEKKDGGNSAIGVLVADVEGARMNTIPA